jgi:endogenous inhibitor of DNA gyrase (YacG/DUF329 family)
MKSSVCPTCGQTATRTIAAGKSAAINNSPEGTPNKAYPFCSPRCQLIDLGRWLGEEYRIAEGVGGDVSGGGIESVPAPGDDQIN